ncbi:MAG: hypothetical protein HYZ75_09825 [Elusimicrobia bacterium]|nr:hypothetical protein [Elusimicrobiota bacterium]
MNALALALLVAGSADAQNAQAVRGIDHSFVQASIGMQDWSQAREARGLGEAAWRLGRVRVAFDPDHADGRIVIAAVSSALADDDLRVAYLQQGAALSTRLHDLSARVAAAIKAGGGGADALLVETRRIETQAQAYISTPLRYAEAVTDGVGFTRHVYVGMARITSAIGLGGADYVKQAESLPARKAALEQRVRDIAAGRF